MESVILVFSRLSARILPALTLFTLALVVPGISRAGEPTPQLDKPAAKAVLIIKDSKDTQTLNAEGQDVTITGNRNKVTIKGACHALTIEGDLNFVSVEAVCSIILTGGGNEVGWIKAEGGEKPEIKDKGKGNVVAHSVAKAD